jgi:hypothetical protein
MQAVFSSKNRSRGNVDLLPVAFMGGRNCRLSRLLYIYIQRGVMQLSLDTTT